MQSSGCRVRLNWRRRRFARRWARVAARSLAQIHRNLRWIDHVHADEVHWRGYWDAAASNDRRPALLVVLSRDRVRRSRVAVAERVELGNGTFHVDLEWWSGEWSPWALPVHKLRKDNWCVDVSRWAPRSGCSAAINYLCSSALSSDGAGEPTFLLNLHLPSSWWSAPWCRCPWRCHFLGSTAGATAEAAAAWIQSRYARFWSGDCFGVRIAFAFGSWWD